MAITNTKTEGGLKTVFDAVGVSSEFYGSEVISAAEFTAGTGVGTVQLQTKLAGDWVDVGSAVTADSAPALALSTKKNQLYRWSCTAFTSGTIATYLQ